MFKTSPTATALTKEFATKIDLVLAAHDYDGSRLVGILLDIQELVPQRYIPEEIAYYAAEKLRVKPTAVYDVISFYSALSDKPQAKYLIQVCDSVVCKINDSQVILDALRELLGIDVGESTYDGRFMIEQVSCFGACDVAPAVRIHGKVYGHLTNREKIAELLDTLL